MQTRSFPKTQPVSGGAALLERTPRVTQARSVRAVTSRGVSPDDVRELIDAAGPLALRDVAAGLGVPAHRAAAVVGWMLDHDCLRQDEWRRLTVRACWDAV